MSLRSMTGFGRGTASKQAFRISVELSSVNRRQLDIQISLPRMLNPLEARIQEQLQKGIARGRVTAVVSLMQGRENGKGPFSINNELAAHYLEKLRRTGEQLKLKDDLSISHLFMLPQVVQYEESQEHVDTFWPLLQRALKQAMGQLINMRTKEGEVLRRDIKQRLDTLAARLRQLQKRAPNVVDRYRKDLKKRLQLAGVSCDPADQRFVREIVLFADRSDVTEETTRLESHLAQAHTLLNSKKPAGKSLDFVAQEMFREINTIGSKANDATMIKYVILFKADLERIREQVQNLE